MDGTMTMTVPSEARKKQTWVHLFISKGTDPFDAGRCVNFAEFTVNPGEEHLLLTDLHSLNAIMKNQLITFDPSLPRLRLCYQIKVNQPDVALTVGQQTYTGAGFGASGFGSGLVMPSTSPSFR